MTNINILGGNFIKYRGFTQLIMQLETLACQKTFWLHYLNVIEAGEGIKIAMDENSRLKIMLSFPIDDLILTQAAKWVVRYSVAAAWVWMIQSDEQYKEGMGMVARYNLMDCEFLPFYNGSNEAFFKINFFIDKADSAL